MIFEIINPSDKYTIETDSWKVAAKAGLLLGRGQYSLQEIGGEHELPIFLFGGLEEWIQDEFDTDIDGLMASVDNLDLATCLDSIVVGDRKNYLLGLGDKTGKEAEAFWAAWHDHNCSSMNDIGSYSKRYAAKLREN